MKIYANSHYVTPRPTLIQAMAGIKHELRARLDQLNAAGRLLEAQRLEQRTIFDLEMMEATGSLRRHRELFALSHRPQAGRAAADAVRIRARQCAGVRRRKPRHRAAARRHVPRRLPPQGDAGRIRLPPALLHGQPAAALRGMGRHAPADASRSRPRPSHWEMNEAGGVFVEQVIRPTGLIDPPVEIRPARTQVDDLVGEVRQVAQKGYRVAGHRADQAHGRGPHRIPARAGHPRALHALRHRHAGAHRDHPRPAARRFRRAGRHQPAARGPRHSGMRAGRHSRCRQGRLPAQRNLADPDHRPRRAQRRRQGDPLCRPGHRLDAARDRRDQPAAREAGRIQHRQRHHAGKHQALDPRHHQQRLRARPRADLDRRRPAPANSPKPRPSGTISRR